MPHPTGGYRNAAGKRVPGVTTITGSLGDKNGIIYAANRLALEPLLELRSLVASAEPQTVAVSEFLKRDPGDWDHKIYWGRSADAGTVAHEMVDDFIHKRSFDPENKHEPRLVEIAKPAFAAFQNWAAQSKLEVGETEKAIVSEKHQFGGTRDAIAVGGNRSVVDWKTSKAIYPEYLVQLAAYGLLDKEAGNEITGGYHLVRFSKQEEPGDPVGFSHHHWSHLDKAEEAFLLARKLYGLMQEIEKLAK